jgi:hypothetical protein
MGLRFSLSFFAAAWLTMASAGADTPDWSDWKFLMGEWVADGDTLPPKTTGGFTLSTDLQGAVLVRKNKAIIPVPGRDQPTIHEDLMVIRPGLTILRPKATYYDSDGHVIEYNVSFNENRTAVTFLSDAPTGEPQYRLTISKAEDEHLAVKFEMATPSNPGVFMVYVTGTVKRK